MLIGDGTHVNIQKITFNVKPTRFGFLHGNTIIGSGPLISTVQISSTLEDPMEEVLGLCVPLLSIFFSFCVVFRNNWSI